MNIYDITQRIPECEVYLTDPPPTLTKLSAIDNGDLYNLTAFSMCTHNGTHIDAPSHFINTGKCIDQIPLEKTVGYAFVAECEGTVSRDEAESILERAKNAGSDAHKKILLKGNSTLSSDAARFFADMKIDLIGVESQTVGESESVMETHLALLSREVVILEGVRLSDVDEDVYFLSATPICISGSDGAPCRAVLIKL